MSALAAVIPVLLGVLCAQLALGVMNPLVPLLLVAHGTATPEIGLIASAYSMGFMAGAVTADRLVIRIGHIRAFAAFAAMAANATLLMSVIGDPIVWAVLRALIGYSVAGVFLVAESWLNGQADNASRGRIFGAYLVASWGGGAVGALALNVAPPSPVLFVAAGIALTTALLPLALTRQANPAIGRQARMGLLMLYRISPVGLACCLTAGLVNGAFYALSPVYLSDFAIPAAGVAVFIAAANVAGLAVQWPLGLLSDRVGRRPMAMALLALALLTALAFALLGRLGMPALLALGCVFAAVTAPLYGLGAGQTNDRLERGDAVAASGGLLFAWAVGATIGPALAGGVMGLLGPQGLFVYLAAVLAGISGFTLLRIRAREEVSRDQRGSFVPARTEPAVLSELDTPAGEGRG
jgi:MFS family permease